MTPNEDGNILGFQIVPVIITADGDLLHVLPPDDKSTVYPVDSTQTVMVPMVYPDGSVFDISVTSNKRDV